MTFTNAILTVIILYFFIAPTITNLKVESPKKEVIMMSNLNSQLDQLDVACFDAIERLSNDELRVKYKDISTTSN